MTLGRSCENPTFHSTGVRGSIGPPFLRHFSRISRSRETAPLFSHAGKFALPRGNCATRYSAARPAIDTLSLSVIPVNHDANFAPSRIASATEFGTTDDATPVAVTSWRTKENLVSCFNTRRTYFLVSFFLEERFIAARLQIFVQVGIVANVIERAG